MKAFAAMVAGLPRIDAIVENASVALQKFSTAEDNETTMTVNVVSAFLLLLFILPKLRDPAERWGISPTMTIVGSNIHSCVTWRDSDNSNILARLSNKETAKMGVGEWFAITLRIYPVCT